MLSRKMRIRRLVLSVALLVVILAVLRLIQPKGEAVDKDEMEKSTELVACDSCQSGDVHCSGQHCACCKCGKAR